MAGEDVASPILQFISEGTYPQSELDLSAELPRATLENYLAELRKAQETAQEEVRVYSRVTAPANAKWIDLAKGMQADILRSREAAKTFVVEANKAQDLKAKLQDAENKTRSMQHEVKFSETLKKQLQQIHHAHGILRDAQAAAVRSDISNALDRLDETQAILIGMKVESSTSVTMLLENLVTKLQSNVRELVAGEWNSIISISPDDRKVEILDSGSGTSLESVTAFAKRTGQFDGLLQRLHKDLDSVILKPMLVPDANGKTAELERSTDGGILSCSKLLQKSAHDEIFDGLNQVLDFLNVRLSESVAIALSQRLVPTIMTKFEEKWLEPSLPRDVSDLPAFQDILNRASSLADHVDEIGWQGSQSLKDWVQRAPRSWLSKRREVLLGTTRDLVFSGLHHNHVIEKTETKMVRQSASSGNPETSREAVQGDDGDDGDDWDTAWDEPENERKDRGHANARKTDDAGVNDDEDVSAWGMEDASDDPTGPSREDEEEAWGWNDEDSAPDPANNTEVKHHQSNDRSQSLFYKEPPSGEQEVTIRESFTVTGIPNGLVDILAKVVTDAETLTGPEYSDNQIATVAPALYSLPTLALAIYRATASTAYSRLDNGNMLIYNDSMHLASRLREWQESLSNPSRLRLENDVKAMESFAKRAYSTEMESQRTILRDLLEGAQGFRDPAAFPMKQECERSVEQTVDRVRGLHRQWKGILSQAALLQSIGSLVAAVAGQMITEIQDLPNIGEDDSHQLTEFIRTVSEIRDLFQHSQLASPEETGSTADMTFIYCPNWLKFQYLGEILESNLADIKYLWNEGELSLEFGSEEVVDLIQALFAESDIRKKTVAEIRRSGRS